MLAERGYQADAAQLAALDRLQRLSDELAAFARRRRQPLRRWIVPPSSPRGVWLYGGVGRGKSFLMDCFHETVPIRRKARLHFHEFMRGVHREMRELRSVEDPLTSVSARIARRYRLICFDEFHLSDIADAMILERLLSRLFGHGVVFVITSNYHPDGLYPDGLHRDRVLPAIDLLKSELDLVAVDAGVDYRRLALQSVETYLVPRAAASDEADHPVADNPGQGGAAAAPAAELAARMTAIFDRLAEPGDHKIELSVENRTIRARRRAGGVVWFDFATLCGGPRSQNDYLELARRFHTILLSGVPLMGPDKSSEARRFTWLVDVLYDQRVKLIVAAAAEPTRLYPAGRMANEFARTASRLIEMQSSAYLEAPRRGVAERIA